MCWLGEALGRNLLASAGGSAFGEVVGAFARGVGRQLSQVVSSPRFARLMLSTFPANMMFGVGGTGRAFQPELPGMPEATARDFSFPQVDAGRPQDSSLYTVVYEVQLDKSVPFSGMSRPEHNQLANEGLYRAMVGDTQLRQTLEAEYSGLYAAVSPGPRGAFPPQSPYDVGLTWHHAPMVYGPTGYNSPAGRMQLVPASHHKAPGAVQKSLHPLPNEGGGYVQWR